MKICVPALQNCKLLPSRYENLIKPVKSGSDCIILPEKQYAKLYLSSYPRTGFIQFN